MGLLPRPWPPLLNYQEAVGTGHRQTIQQIQNSLPGARQTLTNALNDRMTNPQGLTNKILNNNISKAKRALIQLYARLNHLERQAGSPATAWDARILPALLPRKVMRPFIINPSPVQTQAGHPYTQKPSQLFQLNTLTGPLWKSLDNPVTQGLLTTPLGREALALEQKYAVKVIVRPGSGSSYNPQTHTVTLDANQSNTSMQESFIHEMTHVKYQGTGRTADPSLDTLTV